ncbi:MATE family efflux transporter [Tenacibaculum sp. 190524A02b]|uniref:MATE family efflux transporter n=1 Tax=Tenacibaculum vairaonense TaxID=3137860 RepID=UPI0032B24C60
MTNNYSASLVGKYDFIRSFLLVVGSICLLGTDHSILYFSGKLSSVNRSKDLKGVYYTMIKLILLATLFPIIILIILGKKNVNLFFQDSSMYFLILNGTLILFFYCLSILNTEFFRAINLVSLSELFRNIIKYAPFFLGAILLSIFNKQELLIILFLYGFVFISIISTGLLFIKMKRMNFTSFKKGRISNREVFKTSYPMAISNMAFFLLLSIDVMLLKKYKGDEVVAYYSVAVKFVLILSMIINTININVSSKIAELYKSQDFKKLSKLLVKSSRLIVVLSLPLILIVIFFSERILYLFGEKYVESKEALIIMVVSQGICTVFGSVGVYLNMTGKQKAFQNILIMSVVINFILNRFLIPIYGMKGAAISFSCSLFFWNIVSTFYIYRKDKVKVFLK